MSSKGKSSALTGGGAALVPKRRFPEFGGHPIHDVQMADATLESTERNGSGQTSTRIMGVSKVEGIVPMAQHVIAADTARYKCVRKDWFAYNPMRLNIGSIARWHGDDGILVSPDYVVFKCKSSGPHRLDPAYLDHFRRSDIWEAFVSEKGDGGVRVRIYYKDLALLPIALPTFPEQQKISDCLDSADALITAQGRKVEALRAHKNGLMHQLFPQEGETQPRLRFPEFEGAEEWSVKLLGKVAENLDNRRVPITSGARVAGDVPYYGASGIVDYVEGYIFDEDLLCVSEDGANLRARTYPIAFAISGKTWVNNHAHVLRFEHGFTQKFVEVYLNSIALDDFLTGMAQPKLNKAKLDSIPIPIPTEPEQERIADCLTSLDDLIAAESRKLDTLKTHKKGLMQQLFPSIEESQS